MTTALARLLVICFFAAACSTGWSKRFGETKQSVKVFASGGVKVLPSPNSTDSGTDAATSRRQLEVPERYSGASDEKDFFAELNQRQLFDADDFRFEFDEAEVESANGDLRPRMIDTDPVLAVLPSEGVAQNLVTLGPCAVNQPHVHPRGIQASFVLKGPIFFGFLEENGGRFISADIEENQSIVIPQGLIHFAQNRGCDTVQFLANFDNRDPGVLTIASNFFTLPIDTLRGTLEGLDDETISRVAQIAKNAANPSRDPACAHACGLA
ncbi:unnamed protein product [Vitrella brassicaformis CCMP3155]|uniref:Cupin type-1 domain-containing protein n=1 Tax=Vitrella brassicaformis (strain CCMP3155) TaxID=1169540 RepID=A0A0G4GI84_VITBC|nr:unnamed protein product [Vitrella brassicaformis CCMP3155]|eukprot:CEM29301.1 unnamed protein product [Vitrella brassicaformis CCMP3155]